MTKETTSSIFSSLKSTKTRGLTVLGEGKGKGLWEVVAFELCKVRWAAGPPHPSHKEKVEPVRMKRKKGAVSHGAQIEARN